MITKIKLTREAHQHYSTIPTANLRGIRHRKNSFAHSISNSQLLLLTLLITDIYI